MSAAAENSGISVAEENCCTAQLLNVLFYFASHCSKKNKINTIKWLD